jgi:signal transduction histidine kinase
VHRDGERLEQLVGELLALSTGGEPAPVRPVDLDELVLSEVDTVRARAAVAVDLAGLTPVRLPGRAGQLRLVVRNLLQNAERYAVARIAVRVSAGAGTAELVVTDDGPGIPPGERERVFEPFYRLEQARDRASGGAGLGLAIVRDAVTAHGGTVRFDDVPTGAQVRVRLPAG